MTSTTMKIREDVHDRLRAHGNVGDTLSDVIDALLDYYEQREGKPVKKLKVR